MRKSASVLPVLLCLAISACNDQKKSIKFTDDFTDERFNELNQRSSPTPSSVPSAEPSSAAEAVRALADSPDSGEDLGASQGPVVFIGDSLTAALNPRTFFPSRTDILNFGISGNRIGGGLSYDDYGVTEQLSSVVFPYKPKKLFVMIGINDVAMGDSTIQQIEKRYITLFQKLKRHGGGTQIYIQSLLPLGNHPADATHLNPATPQTIGQIKAFNALLKTMSAQVGFTYIDLFTPMLDPQTGFLREELNSDNLHINPTGQHLRAAILEDYL